MRSFSLRVSNRTVEPRLHKSDRCPSSFGSYTHAGSEKTSLVSVASIGGVNAGMAARRSRFRSSGSSLSSSGFIELLSTERSREPPRRGPSRRTERPADASRHRSRSATRSSSDRPATYAPAGPTPSVNGSHHSSKLGCSTATESGISSIWRSPAAANNAVSCPARVPASSDSSSTRGSRSRAAFQNSGERARARRRDPTRRPPTTPSGRVTRAISAKPAAGSDMKWTTSCAKATSNESSENGSSSAVACCTSTSG